MTPEREAEIRETVRLSRSLRRSGITHSTCATFLTDAACDVVDEVLAQLDEVRGARILDANAVRAQKAHAERAEARCRELEAALTSRVGGCCSDECQHVRALLSPPTPCARCNGTGKLKFHAPECSYTLHPTPCPCEATKGTCDRGCVVTDGACPNCRGGA